MNEFASNVHIKNAPQKDGDMNRCVLRFTVSSSTKNDALSFDAEFQGMIRRTQLSNLVPRIARYDMRAQDQKCSGHTPEPSLQPTEEEKKLYDQMKIVYD